MKAFSGKLFLKVERKEKIRNQYNQVPHLTRTPYGKVTQHKTQEGQEVSHFQADDHKLQETDNAA